MSKNFFISLPGWLVVTYYKSTHFLKPFKNLHQTYTSWEGLCIVSMFRAWSLWAIFHYALQLLAVELAYFSLTAQRPAARPHPLRRYTQQYRWTWWQLIGKTSTWLFKLQKIQSALMLKDFYWNNSY